MSCGVKMVRRSKGSKRRYKFVISRTNSHLYVNILDCLTANSIYTSATKDVAGVGLQCYFSDESMSLLANKVYGFLRLKNIAFSDFYFHLNGKYQSGGKFCRFIKIMSALFD